MHEKNDQTVHTHVAHMLVLLVTKLTFADSA